MDLSAGTVLVTGANRGFGRALATELLGRGATVYAASRGDDPAIVAKVIVAAAIDRNPKLRRTAGSTPVHVER